MAEQAALMTAGHIWLNLPPVLLNKEISKKKTDLTALCPLPPCINFKSRDYGEYSTISRRDTMTKRGHKMNLHTPTEVSVKVGVRDGRRKRGEMRGGREQWMFMRELKQHLKPLSAGCSSLGGIRANHTTSSLIHACNNISKVL